MLRKLANAVGAVCLALKRDSIPEDSVVLYCGGMGRRHHLVWAGTYRK